MLGEAIAVLVRYVRTSGSRNESPRPMPDPSVTLSPETIHNPDEARHFMRVKPVGRQVRVRLGPLLLAETEAALYVLEVGKDVYDPVIYVPRDAVVVPLEESRKQTHCPIKGDARYFHLADEQGGPMHQDIAWAYPEPVPQSAALAGAVAFDPAKASFEIIPV